MRVKSKQHLADGEWSRPSRLRKNGTYVHAIKCCDCGLEHIVQYKITKTLRFRAWRLNRTGRVSSKAEDQRKHPKR